MKAIFTTFLILCTISVFAQKKILDHKDVDFWNTIEKPSISSNGDFIIYSLKQGEKDSYLKIKNSNGSLVLEYERAEYGQFSYDSNNAFFSIKPWKDSIKELKRKKVKKDKLPKDTLGIFNLNTNDFIKIGNVKSYKIPEKWSSVIAYVLDETPKENSNKKSDSLAKKSISKKSKKVSKKNGYHLILRNLLTSKQDTFKFVTNYSFAKDGKKLSFISTGVEDIFKSGVYIYDIETGGLKNIHSTKKGNYYNFTFSNNGQKAAFVVDADTTKAQIRPNELYTWNTTKEKATKLIDNTTTPKGFLVSSDAKISFSEDNSKLYFGLSLPPIVKDTTLLDEEIVNVEVWTYNEPQLYTVQEMQAKNDAKKSYTAVLHLNNNKLVQLASKKYPNTEIGAKGDANYALVNNPKPYQLQSQWEGSTARDYALVNALTGETKNILTNVKGRVRLSPKANYVYGYNLVDSTWFSYHILTNKLINLTKNRVFYDELNDSPNYPGSYGVAGWTNNDETVILYDRYDIWEFDPSNGESKQLTNGRKTKTVYRYLKLDAEEVSINKDKKWLLSTFNEIDKSAGYYEYNPKNNKGEQLLNGDFKFSRPLKAVNENQLLFTRQSFEEFPDLWLSNLNFKSPIKITNANPQQKNYNWGTAELVHWTSLDGIKLTGMLIKPENFDASKKYPMIVNFYETSSDGLHNHKAPSAGRSTINYSFYASRGYIIFNPDIYYRVGYPGESAYNCVIPGVTSLIEKGFVDKNNIGVQGHSWGGYQIAYLVTKTNIFKAAESGAPVPNMISAYGGIRWWTGLSRQFQYEHTQSRIGGTPWEFPMRYIENSPIFAIDKINTPLLIMHNDADGHVPWYQGIEFFTALRRLGKPSWFLNYNGEPHWPLKLQNRKDFNIRMQQFFDYYLKNAPKPVWMEKGVPAIEKGVNQGLELLQK
ncbi:prolyl oligopeptidase family serine peptidase [uncultured Lutibacter sp.]|uniref:S9 family peptidase n=1 Tax=uncultured Lutibacter sp. TaxID=437739 RepID=UPI002603C99C|nr:prolyl oligopeptidase family serine peptidase [uncultured Lutibacter sp.]